MPRKPFNPRTDRSNLRARSAGESLNWATSSVKSTPYCLAASMRLPGAGFRSLSAARANSSGVNARSSFTP